MRPEFFVWKYEEYEWAGRTEHKKIVQKKNLSLFEAYEVLGELSKIYDEENLGIEKMENIHLSIYVEEK